ncbi:acyl-CoA thioesterase [Alkalibacterium sp. s-m-22]|uniref:Acyl-CoA thioesterase n=1 Tax=Alkalibacterium indicireducens TaxID=398758 RepID=A0ABP3KK92_9LACT
MTINKQMSCNETRVVQTHIVLPSELNGHQTLFGGNLMSLIDNTASMSVAKFARSNSLVTASMDELHFLHPIKASHAVSVETYVTGSGRRSIEVFTKVLGEDLESGETYIGATSFLTFVLVGSFETDQPLLPDLVCESEEEQKVCRDYSERRKKRLADKKLNEELVEGLTLTPPWMS